MGESRSLRIAVMGVNHAPERSGIAPYTSRLAEALAERGHQVQVLTSRPHYPEWRVLDEFRKARLERHGHVKVRRFRHYIPRNPSWIRRMFFELSFGARLSSTRWRNPDVVICVSPALFSSGMVALRAKVRNKKAATGIIVQDLYSKGIQEAAEGGSALGRVTAEIERRVLNLFDGVVVIHDRFKRQVTQHLGVHESRVSVIRNWSHVSPVPEFNVEEFRKSLDWGSDETVVLHAGAMGFKQGLHNVVDAAREAERTGAPVRFVLLGDGSQRASLTQAAQGLSKIEFHDHFDNEQFGRALVAADVLLVNESPGVRDMAVPSKLTSYFRAGRPVVAATDPLSATAEEVEAAEAGVRVDPGNPAGLVDAVVELAKDPEGAAVMGKRGQDYAERNLSEDAAIQKYVTWVDSLVATRIAETGRERDGSRTSQAAHVAS